MTFLNKEGASIEEDNLKSDPMEMQHPKFETVLGLIESERLWKMRHQSRRLDPI